MKRSPFTFDDLLRDCPVETGHRRLDGRSIGARVDIPVPLRERYPYNASCYAFLQQLRSAIDEFGLIEFPGLPVNRVNYTLAQRAPWQHSYSPNPYMTDICQAPHQDTPPFPTGFWLGAPRRLFATWLVSRQGLAMFMELARSEPRLDIEDLHRRLVPRTMAEGHGLLVNREPGLLLLSNADHQSIHHGRTCLFEAVDCADGTGVRELGDTPMYAYNEVGLLHYMDSLDIRRGNHDRDPVDEAQVRAFLASRRP